MNRIGRFSVLHAPRTARVASAPLPPLAPREVRVRLEGCGVCGSNLPAWEGRPWFSYPLPPGAPGHEGWGRVDAVGSEVENVRAGDRVAVLSYHAFAEYDTAPADQVARLPAALDGHPFPGEALGCAFNVFRRSAIAAGETVAVVGVGFLGAVLVDLAARAGARVFAISRRPAARVMAARLGATETFSTDDPSRVAAAVRELTGDRGCGCVIEATGLQEPLDLATELTAERGRLVIAGYHQDGPRRVNLQLWNWRGLDVINAHERDPRAYLDGIRAAAEAVAAGRLDPTPLYTDRFPLADAGRAFAAMGDRQGSFMKALVTCD